METQFHTMENLFLQLGLDSSPAGVEQFIAEHTIDEQQSLDQAEFWTPAQAAFIRECLEADSDWAEIVDQLNASLRS